MGTGLSALDTSAMRPPIPNRVLVVDDEPLVRWSLCAALDAAGFDAVAAASGIEARRLATEWPPPRVALVDLLGAEDARELLAHVRRIYPECRFVLMTTSRHSLQCLEEKGVHLIEKPFDLYRLVLLVSRLIEDAAGAPPQDT